MDTADSLSARVLAFVAARGRPAWLVGGYVRDRLLGRPSNDLDLIVPEGGRELANSVARAFQGSFFVLDEDRDVARAVLRDAVGRVLEVDVARLRVPALLDDLSLRDFTVNAIAEEIVAGALEGRLLDPFDGQADLTRGLIRAVTEGAFRDDPLRTLRAVRQSVELGFRIEDATYNLIRRDAPLLASVAAERVRDELLRIVSAPGAWRHLRLLANLELLPYTLPESAAQVGVSQSPPHYQDVFDHTRSVVAHLEGIYALLWPESAYRLPQSVPDDGTILAPDWQWRDVGTMLAPFAGELRPHLLTPLAAGRTRRDWLFWAGLAHDWGKPAMRSRDDDGRIRFLAHEHWSAVLVGHRAQGLKLAGDEVDYLARLADGHMRPGALTQDYPPSRRAVYRFYRDLGDLGPDAVLLALADYLATHAAAIDAEHWQRRRDTAQILLEAYFRDRSEQVNPASLLNGHEVMAEFGVKPGPELGRLLEGLREAQAVGEVRNAEEARVWLAERLKHA